MGTTTVAREDHTKEFTLLKPLKKSYSAKQAIRGINQLELKVQRIKARQDPSNKKTIISIGSLIELFNYQCQALHFIAGHKQLTKNGGSQTTPHSVSNSAINTLKEIVKEIGAIPDRILTQLKANIATLASHLFLTYKTNNPSHQLDFLDASIKKLSELEDDDKQLLHDLLQLGLRTISNVADYPKKHLREFYECCLSLLKHFYIHNHCLQAELDEARRLSQHFITRATSIYPETFPRKTYKQIISLIGHHCIHDLEQKRTTAARITLNNFLESPMADSSHPLTQTLITLLAAESNAASSSSTAGDASFLVDNAIASYYDDENFRKTGWIFALLNTKLQHTLKTDSPDAVMESYSQFINKLICAGSFNTTFELLLRMENQCFKFRPETDHCLFQTFLGEKQSYIDLINLIKTYIRYSNIQNMLDAGKLCFNTLAAMFCYRVSEAQTTDKAILFLLKIADILAINFIAQNEENLIHIPGFTKMQTNNLTRAKEYTYYAMTTFTRHLSGIPPESYPTLFCELLKRLRLHSQNKNVVSYHTESEKLKHLFAMYQICEEALTILESLVLKDTTSQLIKIKHDLCADIVANLIQLANTKNSVITVQNKQLIALNAFKIAKKLNQKKLQTKALTQVVTATKAYAIALKTTDIEQCKRMLMEAVKYQTLLNELTTLLPGIETENTDPSYKNIDMKNEIAECIPFVELLTAVHGNEASSTITPVAASSSSLTTTPSDKDSCAATSTISHTEHLVPLPFHRKPPTKEEKSKASSFTKAFLKIVELEEKMAAKQGSFNQALLMNHLELICSYLRGFITPQPVSTLLMPLCVSPNEMFGNAANSLQWLLDNIEHITLKEQKKFESYIQLIFSYVFYTKNSLPEQALLPHLGSAINFLSSTAVQNLPLLLALHRTAVTQLKQYRDPTLYALCLDNIQGLYLQHYFVASFDNNISELAKEYLKLSTNIKTDLPSKSIYSYLLVLQFCLDKMSKDKFDIAKQTLVEYNAIIENETIKTNHPWLYKIGNDIIIKAININDFSIISSWTLSSLSDFKASLSEEDQELFIETGLLHTLHAFCLFASNRNKDYVSCLYHHMTLAKLFVDYLSYQYACLLMQQIISIIKLKTTHLQESMMSQLMPPEVSLEAMLNLMLRNFQTSLSNGNVSQCNYYIDTINKLLKTTLDDAPSNSQLLETLQAIGKFFLKNNCDFTKTNGSTYRLSRNLCNKRYAMIFAKQAFDKLSDNTSNVRLFRQYITAMQHYHNDMDFPRKQHKTFANQLQRLKAQLKGISNTKKPPTLKEQGPAINAQKGKGKGKTKAPLVTIKSADSSSNSSSAALACASVTIAPNAKETLITNPPMPVHPAPIASIIPAPVASSSANTSLAKPWNHDTSCASSAPTVTLFKPTLSPPTTDHEFEIISRYYCRDHTSYTAFPLNLTLRDHKKLEAYQPNTFMLKLNRITFLIHLSLIIGLYYQEMADTTPNLNHLNLAKAYFEKIIDYQLQRVNLLNLTKGTTAEPHFTMRIKDSIRSFKKSESEHRSFMAWYRLKNTAYHQSQTVAADTNITTSYADIARRSLIK